MNVKRNSLLSFSIIVQLKVKINNSDLILQNTLVLDHSVDNFFTFISLNIMYYCRLIESILLSIHILLGLSVLFKLLKIL